MPHDRPVGLHLHLNFLLPSPGLKQLRRIGNNFSQRHLLPLELAGASLQF